MSSFFKNPLLLAYVKWVSTLSHHNLYPLWSQIIPCNVYITKALPLMSQLFLPQSHFIMVYFSSDVPNFPSDTQNLMFIFILTVLNLLVYICIIYHREVHSTEEFCRNTKCCKFMTHFFNKLSILSKNEYRVLLKYKASKFMSCSWPLNPLIQPSSTFISTFLWFFSSS